MLRLVWRMRAMAGMILTTDKVVLAGTANSPAEMGRARARVERGAARLTDGTLAGSVISMLDGVRLMVREVGVAVGQAAVLAATNPANLIGARDRGRLEPGARADLIVLSRALELKAVFVGGREIA
jgi:N-acetylglucosamine-6-phosphate deacetylase